MATKTKTQKTNRLTKAKFVVKKINNDLIDASFEAIETSVKAGEKWQKLTSKLIKKSEPLTKKQISMLLETAENIKGQVELGTNRLKTLVGYDPSMLDKAKNMVTENPLVEKAEKMTAKFKKDVSENPLFIKAEKMGVKLKKEATEVFEDVKGKFEDYAEVVESKVEDIADEVKEKVGKVVKTEKKVTKKKTTTKKKTVAKKKVVAKKPVIVKSSLKNDLKTIKGIGPKMEEVLNSIGITSYEQLAEIAIKDIDAALSLVGINTKVYNTSDWKAQAKIAIKENK